MSSKRENKVASLSVERKKLLKTNNWKHSFSTWKKKWTNVLPILVIFTLENVFIVNFKYLNRGKLLQKDEVLSLAIVPNQTFSKFTTTLSIQFYVMPGKNKIYIPVLIRCKWCNGIYISWGGLRWTITIENIYVIWKWQWVKSTQNKDSSDKLQMFWSMNQIERTYI